MTSIAANIEELATEIHGPQKPETHGVEEFFVREQKESSVIPHKRDLVGSGNVTGLARMVHSHAITAFENVNLRHR